MTHRFIDTHCHFDFPPFVTAAEHSIAQAAQAGVERIIVPCVDASRFAVVSQLAQQHPALYAALGLHPIVIEQHQDDDLDRLEQYLQTPDVKRVAIGEIGLDLYTRESGFCAANPAAGGAAQAGKAL